MDSVGTETILSAALFLEVDPDESGSAIAKSRRYVAALVSADGLVADRIDSDKVTASAGVVQW